MQIYTGKLGRESGCKCFYNYSNAGHIRFIHALGMH